MPNISPTNLSDERPAHVRSRASIPACLWTGAIGVGSLAFLIGQFVDPPTLPSGPDRMRGGLLLGLFLWGGGLCGLLGGAIFAGVFRGRAIRWNLVFLGLAGLNSIGFLAVQSWPAAVSGHDFARTLMIGTGVVNSVLAFVTWKHSIPNLGD